jgi:hypothetical protein
LTQLKATSLLKGYFNVTNSRSCDYVCARLGATLPFSESARFAYGSAQLESILTASSKIKQESNDDYRWSPKEWLRQPCERVGSPAQSAHGSGHFEFGTDEGPYLDFDLDAEGEVGFNFDDEGQMIGDIPGDNSGNDEHQKRKSIPDDEEDDEGGGKRREGDDKSGKKPGRKPLTSEPTTVSPKMISARRLHTNFR